MNIQCEKCICLKDGLCKIRKLTPEEIKHKPVINTKRCCVKGIEKKN